MWARRRCSSTSGATCPKNGARPCSSVATHTRARFRAAIADGIASGAFALTDPSLAATFLLTALNGIPTWYRPTGSASPAQLADLYADLAVRSLTEASR